MLIFAPNKKDLIIGCYLKVADRCLLYFFGTTVSSASHKLKCSLMIRDREGNFQAWIQNEMCAFRDTGVEIRFSMPMHIRQKRVSGSLLSCTG